MSNNKNHQRKIAAYDDESLLSIKRSEQYKTVDELIEGSQPNSVYFWLLVFSTLIIASGLLLNNSSIVVGGMLVTPVLTPILVIALYLSIGELHPIKYAGLMLLKSFGIIFGISFGLAIAFGAPKVQGFLVFFENTTTTTLLYLLVSFAAGVVATIGLTRKDVPDLFPGIAIAISLVPPLSSIAIWLSAGDLEQARTFLVIFLANVVGIVVGSLIVFSMLKFHKTARRVQERVAEVEAEAEAKKEEKATEKAVEKVVKEVAEKVAKEAIEKVKKEHK